MRLMNARLCLDCEEVHDEQHCPICSSESFAFLTRWVTPSDRPRPPSTHAARDPARRIRSERREQVDAYRQILNPAPAAAETRAARGHGALGLALLGVARMVWRAAPEPRTEPKPDSATQQRTGTSERHGGGVSIA